jgi:hypothetical protein
LQHALEIAQKFRQAMAPEIFGGELGCRALLFVIKPKAAATRCREAPRPLLYAGFRGISFSMEMPRDATW